MQLPVGQPYEEHDPSKAERIREDDLTKTLVQTEDKDIIQTEDLCDRQKYQAYEYGPPGS